MKMTPQTKAEAAAEKALKPLIAYAAKQPGFKERLAAYLSEKTGTKVFRQQVAEWLHHDQSKRSEPRLGAGLLLIKHGDYLMMREKEADNA